jgi:exodeoxyribonuclease VII large subunit
VGEVDEYRVIHNKWVTFKIKDETASVGCFMTVWQLRTVIEDGMLVRAAGTPKLREKGGYFSFVLSDVKPAGEGALKRAFELLQQKLAAEGLFAAERKRPLPRFPRHVALITSRDAAAYSDFLKVLQARMGGINISFLHTQVQGEPAPRQIVQALEAANAGLKKVDAIVLVRGGGSLEDLAAFNDEMVVRAVAASRTPTVVGVGHERDVTLAELAADVRASTPSNAAELLVRTREEVLAEVQYMKRRIGQAVLGAVQTEKQTTESHEQDLRQAVREAHKEKKLAVDGMARMLANLYPERTMARGYSITRTEQGQLVISFKQTPAGTALVTQVSDGSIHSQVRVQ